MATTESLASIGGRQHGLITLRQIEQLRRMGDDIDVSELQRVRRGLYSIEPGPLSWVRSVAAATLSPTNRVIASHRTAAQLHDLLHVDVIEVSVQHPRRIRSTDAQVHRVRALDDIDVCVREGIPTTTVTRTLCDLGAVVSPPTVARMVDHVIATEMTTRAALWRTRIRLGASGRNGVGVLHRALSSVPIELDLAESGPEIALYRIVCDLDVPRPVPQHPITIGGVTYYADLALPGHRIALEYDGSIAHDSPAQQARDRRRDAAFASAGWTTLRFRWADISALNARQRIGDRIHEAMTGRRAA